MDDIIMNLSLALWSGANYTSRMNFL